MARSRRTRRVRSRHTKAQQLRSRRLKWEGLEDRRLLAGESIAFVDPTIWDNASVPTELTAAVDEVVVLDAQSDGIQQMADYLNGRTELGSIHLISHGAVGEIAPIGSGAVISSENVADYASQLAVIGNSLAAEGDILLWGCEVAGAEGVGFVQSMAAMTGADIAASDDTTGSPALGGDWDLEYATGPIEASNILAGFDPQITLFHESFFRITDASVSEGNTAFFTISRSGNTNFSSAVRYFTSSNSATTSDYVPESANLSFPGGVASRTVTIATRSDSIDELTETFFVRLSRIASNGFIADSLGVGTIFDATPTSRVSVSNATVSEGGTASFIVSKDRPSSFTTSVQYATSPGSASPADFIGESGTVVFAPFQTRSSITVQTREDRLDEPTESFLVRLLSASGMSIADSSGTGLIIDDDHTPVANAGGPYVINEGGSLTLNATSSTDADGDLLTFRWDVDGDGDFDENVTGVTPTVSAAQMSALGLDDGPYSGVVRVEASDGFNRGLATTQLTINNVAPEIANLAITSPVDENGFATLTGDILDPGNDSFTMVVDWGDGAPETYTIAQGSTSFSVQHQYLDDGTSPGNGTASDDYTVSVVSFADDDGALQVCLCHRTASRGAAAACRTSLRPTRSESLISPVPHSVVDF